MKGIRFYADLPGTAQTMAIPMKLLHPKSRYDAADDKTLLPLRSTIRDLREYAALGGTLNCVALLLGKEHQCQDYTQECLSATFWHADSDTSLCSVSHDYLRKCRRIPESLARTLHPRLAQRLDN